jgi:outer membrane murein-binding lipoprotein Lpp
MKLAYTAAVAGLVVTLLSGCASRGAVDAVRRDVDETKTRIYSLEKDLSTAREGEKGLKDEFAALRKSDADLQASLDGTRTEMQALAGKVDDFGVGTKKSADQLVRYREDVDRRIVAIEDRIVK